MGGCVRTLIRQLGIQTTDSSTTRTCVVAAPQEVGNYGPAKALVVHEEHVHVGGRERAGLGGRAAVGHPIHGRASQRRDAGHGADVLAECGKAPGELSKWQREAWRRWSGLFKV